jgi:hypothetical protein
MKKIITIFYFVVFSSLSSSACGIYEVAAVVRLLSGVPVLVVNPDTISEVRLYLKLEETPKLAAYLDQLVSANLNIVEAHGNIAVGEKIQNIQRLFNDGLSQKKGSYLKPLKVRVCTKL